MQRLKLAAFAVAIALIAGTSFSIQAQKKTKAPIKSKPIAVGDILRGTYSSNVSATGISEGQADFVAGQMYGATNYGPTKGDLSGHVFVSMNYRLPSFPNVDPVVTRNASLPAVPSEVTGGSWSQLIYIDDVFAGSVSGRIIGGTVTWDNFRQTATITLKLEADGGTDAYVGASGSGEFVGTLNRTGLVPTMTGTLTLNY